MQKATLDLIEQHISDWKLPSLVYGFIQSGEQHLQAINTVTDTAFPIASISKTFTAYCLLRAQEQGLIDWDDPIRKHLNDFTLQDSNASKHITIRDLLCHQTGLPPHTWAWVYSGCTRNEFIQTRLPHLASIGPFRNQHAYSNIGYAILGAVVEAVSGKPWEKFLNDEVLLPRGMTQTQHLRSDWHKHPNMAQPFAMESGEPVSIPPFHAEENHPIAPASELASTGPDLLKWLSHHLDTPEVAELFKPLIPINDQGVHYGMGWRMEERNQATEAWHSGSCSGYSSLLALRPAKQDGLFFLSNTHGITTELRDLSKTIFNLWDGQPTARIDFKPSPYSVPQQDTNALAQLTGTFQNPGYGSLAVSAGRVSMNGHPMGVIQNTPNDQQMLVFQDYNIALPLEFNEGSDILNIPLEPECSAISFRKNG